MGRRWRSLQWLIIAVLILFGLGFLPIVRDGAAFVFGPPVRAVRRGGESVINSVKLVFSIGSLSRENGELKARVNELTALEVTNNELKHENDLLRKELNVSAQSAGSLIAAQVISRSASVTQQTLLVNKGTDDGFKLGMAVVAQGYLVGVVDEVQAHSSRIVLVTSAQSLLPIVLQNSRAVGLLRGGVDGLLIDEVPTNVAITPGEAIVTANVGDIVKSGIPVGTVSAVSSGKSDVFQSARVIVPIDLSRLEVVFGVK